MEVSASRTHSEGRRRVVVSVLVYGALYEGVHGGCSTTGEETRCHICRHQGGGEVAGTVTMSPEAWVARHFGGGGGVGA